MMQYELVHIIGISFSILFWILSALLIIRFSSYFEEVQLFWIPWLLVAALVLGNKFI